MAVTDQVQKLIVVAGGKAKDVKNDLADADKRSAYIEAGRIAVSQGTALVTDKAAAARDLVTDGWRKTTRTVEDIMTPPPVWDNSSKKAKLYAVASSTREQARVAKNKGLTLVQTHGPKVTAPARKLGRKTVTTTQAKTPAARSFVSRNRDLIFLGVAVVNVIVAGRRVIVKRRGRNKK